MKNCEDRENKRITIINIVFSLLFQVVTMIYGFIVPRIILKSFGSEVNGLISSVSQFLNYIILLEGGVTGVVASALYRPLRNKDYVKVSGICKAARKFFKRISYVFLGYALLVSVIYPTITKSTLSKEVVFALTLIIAFNTFIQYCFSLHYRVLINSDRRGAIVSAVSIVITLGNLMITLLVISIYKNIIVLKMCNAILFLLQPIVFSIYVKKKYPIDYSVTEDKDCLNQRWDGFGQNLAYFVHNNTDVILITLLSTLSEVSVYSVYYMVVSALKMLVTSVSKAINPTMGNVLMGQDSQKKEMFFDTYSLLMNMTSSFVFGCGIVLITPFISVYTMNISDVSYYQPMLGVFLMLAEAVYCLREPYISVAYVVGHFKQTAKYAYIETILNIVLSILLYFVWGIVGIAVATFISMLYRAIAHVLYLKKNTLYRPIRKALNSGVYCGCIFLISWMIMTKLFDYNIISYVMWLKYACIVAIILLVLTVVGGMIFERKLICNVLQHRIKQK